MPRQIGKGTLALLDAACGVNFAEQLMVARLMAAGEEREHAGLADTPRRTRKRPAGEDAGERGHVALRISIRYAQCVQLENLACQVLVESAPAGATRDGRGPERSSVVEIEQHGRMDSDGFQHVAEAAEHVWPDGLALEGAGDGAHRPALGDGNTEMLVHAREPLDAVQKPVSSGSRCLPLRRVLDANLLGVLSAIIPAERQCHRLHKQWRICADLALEVWNAVLAEFERLQELELKRRQLVLADIGARVQALERITDIAL